ncbi:MAG: hypothetical protein GY711_25260 [bacterium]|nr:hypothetical protein [bacterium]
MREHLRRWILSSVAGTCAACGAFAQHVVYDAGTAGNPPVAPSPLTQGFSLQQGTGTVGLHPVNDDNGRNAWEVADSDAAPNAYAHYASQHDVTLALMGTTWELTATLRMTAGPDPAIAFGIGSGCTIPDSHYTIRLEIVNTDVVATDDLGGGGPLFCAGGAEGYHTFTIRKTTPGLYVPAEFLYDGVLIGPVGEHIADLDTNVFFGTLSYGGAIGRARFHRVEMRSLDDLGATYCSPAVANSTGFPAVLTATGSPYVNQNFLTLSASQLPPGQFGYFLASQTQGMVVPPGSQGLLCLSGNTGRFDEPQQIVQGPGGDLDVDLAGIPVNPPAAAQVGDTWNFQCWYRDVGGTSNFSDALSVTFR